MCLGFLSRQTTVWEVMMSAVSNNNISISAR